MSDIPETLPDEALAATNPSRGKPDAAPAVEHHHGEVRLGPSRLYPLWLLFINPFTWVAVGFMLFAYSAEFRQWIYNFADGLAFIQRGMIQFFVWNKTLLLPFWVWPTLVSVLYATVRAMTTHYVLTDDGILSVRHGLLSLRSPGGPFQQYIDTIPLGLVRDADLKRGLAELIMGTGTISLRSRETADGSGWSHLYHVPQAESARRMILSHSPVHDTKVIVSA